MTNSRIRTLRWIAPVAMAGVLGFAACGGANAAEDARTETRVASRGSDTHLYNQAEETAERSASVGRGSDNRLYNQAEALAKVFAERSASAEQLERTAKLEGQADTYRASSAPRVIISAEQVEHLLARAHEVPRRHVRLAKDVLERLPLRPPMDRRREPVLELPTELDLMPVLGLADVAQDRRGFLAILAGAWATPACA
jgi:hypothetical protein